MILIWTKILTGKVNFELPDNQEVMFGKNVKDEFSNSVEFKFDVVRQNISLGTT